MNKSNQPAEHLCVNTYPSDEYTEYKNMKCKWNMKQYLQMKSVWMEEMSMNLCISYGQQRKPIFNHSCHGNSFHLFLLLSSKNATHIHYLKKKPYSYIIYLPISQSLKPKVIGVFDTVFFGFLHL